MKKLEILIYIKLYLTLLVIYYIRCLYYYLVIFIFIDND